MLLFAAFLLIHSCLLLLEDDTTNEKKQQLWILQNVLRLELSCCCCFGPQYQGIVIIITHSHLTSPEVGGGKEEEDGEQIYRLVQRDEWWRKLVSFPRSLSLIYYVMRSRRRIWGKEWLNTRPSSSSSYHQIKILLLPFFFLFKSQIPLNWWSYHRIVH